MKGLSDGQSKMENVTSGSRADPSQGGCEQLEGREAVFKTGLAI